MSAEKYSAHSLRAARQQLIDSGIGTNAPAPRTLGVPAVIERSWRRSVVQHSPFDSSATPQFRPLPGSADPLSYAAKTVLEHWADSLADMRVALFVSDRTGHILARETGERDHARRLDRVYAAEGFDFSENALGTNGLGTPLEERSAVFVRGAEHFNDALHSLACAGAPIHDVLSGRVIGSVALAAPVDAANATMLAIARQVARQVEESMSEAAYPGELRSLLARLIDGSANQPVFALSRSGVLSTTPALPLLSAGSHVLLWDELQSGEWSDDTRTVSFAGRPGTARRISTRGGEDVFVVELADDAESAERSHDDRLSEGDPIARLDELASSTGAVWISGPARSGKTHLATTWLQGRDGRAPVVVEASDARSADVRERLAAELREGTSAIIRHIETLGGHDTGWLRSLMASVDPTRPPRLVATFDDSGLDPELRAIVDRSAPQLRIPALRDQPERIAAIAQEIAARHGATISPAALQALVRWDWPGDVAELSDLVTRLSRASRGGTIAPDSLPIELRTCTRRLYGIAASEYRAIETALRDASGNRSRAAESLGIGRTTLYRKMREYGLDGSASLTA